MNDIKLQPARFTMDSLGDTSFEGYTAGETWNGWDCPYFTYEQAQKVVDAFNASQRLDAYSVQARYDAERDAFCFYFKSSGESDDFPAVELDGHKFYPIGAGAWIWEREGRWQALN